MATPLARPPELQTRVRYEMTPVWPAKSESGPLKDTLSCDGAGVVVGGTVVVLVLVLVELVAVVVLVVAAAVVLVVAGSAVVEVVVVAT